MANPAHADHRIYANLKQLVALQHQAHGFSLLPTQPLSSVLAGRHSSRLRGRGLNFEELRQYRPGDDIRNLDWKVTNRTQTPHVRTYTEERERNILLLIDQRRSMFFGSRERMKSVTALEVAALAAWRTLASGDRVGALLFNDHEIREVRPQRSQRAVMQLLHQGLRMNHALSAVRPNRAQPQSGINTSQLDTVLLTAARRCGHDYLVVIISDMCGWSPTSVKHIKGLTRHNDLIVPLIFDPLEQQLPAQRLVVGDGRWQLEVDAAQRQLQQRYSDDFAGHLDRLRAELEHYAVPVIAVDTLAPVQQQLRQALGGR
ncbi:DUF58 domain-containing protein [Aestuariirhabdus sp. Z084]|uniref:DUF58 domain-containing protein n=1 Tax=Aestuariirhabdus haliotis TaxID=2918751 RepID=UPI00201B3958|nr:DUF58 domain-containing protein [Aestuariirhabdus haliotis]MCL6416444.1 DUF58 domain-containing protein [Aestuariirhabdus haliotis]MCL6420389.1 DUF58 domain-containing protein [Aestuariirhabdus haliotis]